MSVHSVTVVNDPMEGVTGLRPAVTAAIRAPDAVNFNGTTVDYVFTPDLTPAETSTFNDLVSLYRIGLSNSLSLAEFQAIKGDLATARAFVSIASPTNAQVVAAVKSTIRVVGALLRS